MTSRPRLFLLPYYYYYYRIYILYSSSRGGQTLWKTFRPTGQSTIFLFLKKKKKNYYTDVGLWKTLWKTCGNPVENSCGKLGGKVFHRRFPQVWGSYPQVFHSFIHRFSTGLCPLFT